MFLKNLQLKNFKCHAELAVDFTTTDGGKVPVRKTTFVTGENGAGKSALLQAIAMVTGGSEALRYLPGFPNTYIRYGFDTAEISATIATAQGEERELSLILHRDEPVWDAVTRARTTLAPMDAALRHTHRSYFVAGFGSGRRVDPAMAWAVRLYPSGSTRYAAVHSLFNRDALLRPLPAWAADVLERGGAEAMDTLASAINTFLPEAVRFHSITADGLVMFSTPDGLLPLEQLSNGYQQTVAWVGDLLYHVTRTFGDYKNPLSARGVLLIDEADLHLHPAWQRQLYQFLQKGLPQMQVIATTYSPVTASEAGANEVLVLERDPVGIPLLASPRRAVEVPGVTEEFGMAA
jgi:hypothetical protein